CGWVLWGGEYPMLGNAPLVLAVAAMNSPRVARLCRLRCPPDATESETPLRRNRRAVCKGERSAMPERVIRSPFKPIKRKKSASRLSADISLQRLDGSGRD